MTRAGHNHREASCRAVLRFRVSDAPADPQGPANASFVRACFGATNEIVVPVVWARPESRTGVGYNEGNPGGLKP